MTADGPTSLFFLSFLNFFITNLHFVTTDMAVYWPIVWLKTPGFIATITVGNVRLPQRYLFFIATNLAGNCEIIYRCHTYKY